MNKVVARYTDGRVLKGTTVDFSASRPAFHITQDAPIEEWVRTEVLVDDLKALFYVKDLEGNPDHVDSKILDTPPPPGTRGVRVTFFDGEVLVGTTPRYHINGPGFFVVPADPESNNDRCFIVEAATTDVMPLC